MSTVAGGVTFCAACGTALEPGAVFCGTCGSRVAGSAPVSPASAGPASAAASSDPTVPGPTASGSTVTGTGVPGSTASGSTVPGAGGAVGAAGAATPGWSLGADVDDAVAPVWRRLVALLVDQLLAVVVGGAGLLVVLGTVREDGSVGALLVPGLLLLVLATGQWLGEAFGGRTIGGALLGIRTLSARTGRPAGLWAVLVRSVVQALGGLVGGIGVYVIAGSGAWDEGPEQRGWHDKAAGTLVLRARPVDRAEAAGTPAGSAAASAPATGPSSGLTSGPPSGPTSGPTSGPPRTAAEVVPAAAPAPSAGPTSGPPPSAVPGPAAPVPAPSASSEPAAPAPTAEPTLVPTAEPALAAPGTPTVPAEPAPVQAPPPRLPVPAAPVVAAASAPAAPAPGPEPEHAAPAPPVVAPVVAAAPVPTSPVAPESELVAPGPPAVDAVSPARPAHVAPGPAAAPATPDVAPAVPAPAAPVPGRDAPDGLPDSTVPGLGDLEHTRVGRWAAGPEAAGPAAALVLVVDTGDRVRVTGAGLIGRRPVPGDETWAHLVTIDDPAQSVSSTHLAFWPAEAGLDVVDRGSTNGTVLLDPAGKPWTLPPGAPARVAAGWTLVLGTRRVRVDPA